MEPKKKLCYATIEEMIADICSCEDIDSALIIAPECEWDGGGVAVMGYDFYDGINTTGKTLREALVEFGKEAKKRWPPDPDYDYDKLDWES